MAVWDGVGAAGHPPPLPPPPPPPQLVYQHKATPTWVRHQLGWSPIGDPRFKKAKPKMVDVTHDPLYAISAYLTAEGAPAAHVLRVTFPFLKVHEDPDRNVWDLPAPALSKMWFYDAE